MLENVGGKAKKRGVKLIDKSVIIRDERCASRGTNP
jgi:hypothetical protein